MPLLHRKPFTRTPPPADLNPTERLFYCRVTNEVFRDYDEFFERTILCNSLVWSCAFTGKSGLTYQEALESEKKVKKSLQTFPEPMAVPVLYLATLATHQKVSELCDDVYDYVKDRFFVGETVTVVRNSGARLDCTVLEIKAPPQQNGMTNGHNADNDTIVISDSDEDETPVPDSWKKIEPIDATLFKYKVKPVVEAMYESVTVRQCQVSRKSSVFSKERLKYFLKLHCEIQNGLVKPKAATLSKYQILEKNFFRYFPDEPPTFKLSPDRKPPPKENGLTPRQSLLAAAKERERIMQHRRELRAMELEKERMRRERADRIKSRAKDRQQQIHQKEEFKKMAEKKKEARKSIKLERDQEREKIREEKRQYAERLKMWSKRRDDMECDDLMELPAATPVKTRLPPECFGDALMVSEFLHGFGDFFDLKDEFPEGMSFEMLEEALVGSDPEGPLCELLFFFLSAIFQAMSEEEEEVAKDQITEAEAKRLKEALGEGTDSTNYALFAVASLAAAWPQLNHGCSLKQLNLDSCTLSEILRLHILSSGADSNSASAKYRYQKQGGFVATDDACMELRLNHPAILKKLTTTSVYSLFPDEKLKILHALIGKLLTLVSTRDYIEDCVEELRQAKQEFRELKAGQNRKEREEAAARIRKRKEEKLKEQEQKLKEKEEKLREDENKDVPKAEGNGEQEESQAGNENKESEQKEQDAATEDEEAPPAAKKRRGTRGQNGSKEKNSDSQGTKETEPVDEERQKQNKEKREQELIEKIQQVTACTNITPLGRDRSYRRFWTFFSVPGLFVEEDYTGITEDMLQPCPASHREPETNPAVNGHDGSTLEVEEEPEAPKPVNKPNRWLYYSSEEQLEQLIQCLNTRGYRESTLKDTLLQEKSKICQKLSNFPSELFNISESPPPEDTKPGQVNSLNALDSTQTSGEKQLELRLGELLLDIEDRIYQGSLGTVKAPDRQLWRSALERGSYELLDDDSKDRLEKDNGVEEMEVDDKQSIKDGLQGIKKEEPSVPSTTASTPQPTASSVQYLARALLQIEKGVERKYLKAPLGDAEDTKKDKKKKEEKKKKEDDQTSEKDDASESSRSGQRTILDRWRESLESSGSLSQIFLHLSTLDHSIVWSRSILNLRCKVCRKKGDSESMLLCHGCERGHHIYCVRPKLKFIPDGDWFCPECRPRQRARKPDRQRPSMDSEVEEEDFSEEEEIQGDSPEKDEEEEAAMSEGESTKNKSKAKLQLSLKIKGGKSTGKPGPKKKPGRPPKATPPASKGRGRKVQSAPPQGKKAGGRHSISASQSNAEAHETSLVELVSTPGVGRGRGRGRGKKIKSVDNTPVGTPFAFRPFSLDNVDNEQTPKGRKERSDDLTPTPKGRGRGKKRLSEIAATDLGGNRRSSGRHQGVHELSACEQLVVELVRHDDSWPFMRLVSKAQVPDYFDIIQKPIALNIIREKVNKCEYNSATEFIDDVQLMFTNCFEYNNVNSNEAKAGLRLQSFFVREAQKLDLDVPLSKPVFPPGPSKKSRI